MRVSWANSPESEAGGSREKRILATNREQAEWGPWQVGETQQQWAALRV